MSAKNKRFELVFGGGQLLGGGIVGQRKRCGVGKWDCGWAVVVVDDELAI